MQISYSLAVSGASLGILGAVVEAAPVLLVAPSWGDVEPSAGQVVAVSRGVYAGTAPIDRNGVLTLGGQDVTGDMVGNTYTVPSGTAAGVVLEWSEAATNAIGAADPVSASVAIAAGVEPDAPDPEPVEPDPPAPDPTPDPDPPGAPTVPMPTSFGDGTFNIEPVAPINAPIITQPSPANGTFTVQGT